MEDSPPLTDSRGKLVRLVPSGITLLSVIGLIVAARFYEVFPLKPTPCGLRTLTGVPCLACGGTRSMQALAQGEFLSALSLNPLVIIVVIAIVLWFARSLWQTLSGAPPRPKKKIPTRWIVAACVVVGLANWIYLFLYLPD